MIAGGLAAANALVPTSASEAVPAGIQPELHAAARDLFSPSPIAAAVLVPIVAHPHELTVLLTERASHLRQHAGQISFPGGRIEPDDLDVVQAALRESEEEIGMSQTPTIERVFQSANTRLLTNEITEGL